MQRKWIWKKPFSRDWANFGLKIAANNVAMADRCTDRCRYFFMPRDRRQRRSFSIEDVGRHLCPIRKPSFVDDAKSNTQNSL